MSSFYTVKESTLNKLADKYKNKGLLMPLTTSGDIPAGEENFPVPVESCSLEDMTSNFNYIDYRSKKVNYIPYCMFYQMTNLRNVFCYGNPELTVVNAHAFNNTSVKTVKLPTVKTVNDCAFFECFELENLDLLSTETVANTVFYECFNLKELNLPSAKSIGTRTFHRCTGLEKLFLPSSDYCSLGSPSSFQGTPIMPYEELELSKGVVTTFNLRFDKDGYIYVKEHNLVETYKNLSKNKDFADRIRPYVESEFDQNNELIGYIYVNKNLVSKYQDATQWALLKDKIKAIS